MKELINPKYQFFLLPFTFVFVSVFVAINYVFNRDFRKAILCIIKTFFFSATVYIFIPLILEMIGLPYIYDTKYFLLYFYIFSTVFGVYIIREQILYFSKLKDLKWKL